MFPHISFARTSALQIALKTGILDNTEKIAPVITQKLILEDIYKLLHDDIEEYVVQNKIQIHQPAAFTPGNFPNTIIGLLNNPELCHEHPRLSDWLIKAHHVCIQIRDVEDELDKLYEKFLDA